MRLRRRWGLVALTAAFLALGYFGFLHLRAASLLARMAGDHGRIARSFECPISEREHTLQTRNGTIRARVYFPSDGHPRRGIVLAPGVHYRGIDEPRLIPFARHLARTGFAVITPEIPALAAYRIHLSNTAELLAAARFLGESSYVSRPEVGVMGLSFAGGLALRAAGEPDARGRLSFVMSVGGYDDLYRVSRFLATEQLTTPEGEIQTHAHDYGLVVIIYDYAERFVDPASLPAFREGLRLFLHGDRPAAVRAGATLTGDPRWVFERILAHDRESLRPRVMPVLDAARDEMARGSPSSVNRRVSVPVYLLHGAMDDVIPPSEARFASRELTNASVHLLVSPAFEHVTVHGHPTGRQQWELIHFIAQMLHE